MVVSDRVAMVGTGVTVTVTESAALQLFLSVTCT